MKTTSTTYRGQRAFTITEILVVMVIITILMTFLVTGVAGLRSRARKQATEQRIRLLSVAIEEFKSDHGTYPPDRIDAVLRMLECGSVDLDPLAVGAQVPGGYYSDAAGEDNEGIKALWIALTCPKAGGPYLDEDKIGNARALPGEHVYYTLAPRICDGGDLVCNTTANNTPPADDVQIVAVGAAVTAGETVVTAGPNGVLDTTATADDYVMRGDPQPIAVLIDAWGHDLRYDRVNSSADNAAANSPDPTIAGAARNVPLSGDSHMLRSLAGFDLWSVGGNGIDECIDSPPAPFGETDRTLMDPDDGDDVANWSADVYP